MSGKTPWQLDEPVMQGAGVYTLCLGGLSLLLLTGAVLAEDSFARTACILALALMLGLLALMVWLSRHYRLVMDDQGVRLGTKYALEWSQVRTAAVIERGYVRRHYDYSRRGEWHFILLSVQMPEKAIDKWTFRMERAKPGREIRIPYTDDRRSVVEHYLNKTLPTFRL